VTDIVLFGASGGIGQYLVGDLAPEHRIVGTYLRADPSKLRPGAEYHRVDVTDPASVAQFAEQIQAGLQHPVLVYTPGISPNAVAHKVTDADWERTIATNISGAMRAARVLLPRMRALGWGRIVLISSVLARQGVPGTLAYSATKAAMAAMTRVISVENATKGITANTLALGYFSVGIIEAVPAQYLREHVLPGIPQGRLGDPANIAAAIRLNGGMLGA
jgi:acetoacetyl-CoA reductase